MKKAIFLSLALCCVAFATDRIFEHDIAKALNSKFAEQRLKPDVALRFSKEFGGELEYVQSQRGTHKYRREAEKKPKMRLKGDFEPISKGYDPESDGYERACQYAFVSVLADLQAKARAAGKNSVVNIQGYFKKRLFNSEDKFQCAVGSFSTTVTLIGNLK